MFYTQLSKINGLASMQSDLRDMLQNIELDLEGAGVVPGVEVGVQVKVVSGGSDVGGQVTGLERD